MKGRALERSWICNRRMNPLRRFLIHLTLSQSMSSTGQNPWLMIPRDAIPGILLWVDPRPSTAALAMLDASSAPLCNPDELHYPRLAEWFPSNLIGPYLEHWARCPLSKKARAKLRAECPRPVVPSQVCETPTVDPKLVQFLTKMGWNPKKGMESSLTECQDKLLDFFGPLANIFEMAESAKSSNKPINPPDLSAWVQQMKCVGGNVNASFSIERRKAILPKVEPKLANLVLTEAGKVAKEGFTFRGTPSLKSWAAISAPLLR